MMTSIAATSAYGQQFELRSSAIAAGGGASTGGSLTLSGTSGQFDAGTPLSGGSFELIGGFWP
ncbi:hypothetical protein, partial [Salmonella enterica]|uniref:hypothetical protein n=1 Tax=Salmonella enterica TaxID=28901 RepID=UPI0039EA8BD3